MLAGMDDSLQQLTKREPFRMVIWLLAGLLCYAASMGVGIDYPQAQVILQKTGLVTFFSWLGYLISRNALGRLDHERAFAELATTNAMLMAILTGCAYIARAILMGFAIYAGSVGL